MNPFLNTPNPHQPGNPWEMPTQGMTLPTQGLIDVSGSLFGVASKLGLGRMAMRPMTPKTVNRLNKETIPFIKKLNKQKTDQRKNIAKANSKKRAVDAAAMSSFVLPDMYELLKSTNE